MNPRSTDFEADALTTTPSRRFMLSTSCLLTFARLKFEGFISQHLRLIWKFGLWSFNNKKACCSGSIPILSSNYRCSVIAFASKLISFRVLSAEFPTDVGIGQASVIR